MPHLPHPNYSPASAAVASAAKRSRERPQPGPERGNLHALSRGSGSGVGSPPAWEAAMADQPARRSPAADYWAELGELAAPFKGDSEGPAPRNAHPHT